MAGHPFQKSFMHENLRLLQRAPLTVVQVERLPIGLGRQALFPPRTHNRSRGNFCRNTFAAGQLRPSVLAHSLGTCGQLHLFPPFLKDRHFSGNRVGHEHNPSPFHDNQTLSEADRRAAVGCRRNCHRYRPGAGEKLCWTLTTWQRHAVTGAVAVRGCWRRKGPCRYSRLIRCQSRLRQVRAAKRP